MLPQWVFQSFQIELISICLFFFNQAFSLQSRILLLTNLPQYWNGRFTESDISNLLHEFGFQYEDKNLFVIPQACMVGPSV